MQVKRVLPIILALLCSVSLHGSATTEATDTQSIWVFTADHLPPLHQRDLATDVFVLNAIDRSLETLSFRFPGTERKARDHASVRLNSPEGQRVLAELKANARVVALARQYGIAKLPAVVIDRQYVVYGEYDLARALERVRQHRNAR